MSVVDVGAPLCNYRSQFHSRPRLREIGYRPTTRVMDHVGWQIKSVERSFLGRGGRPKEPVCGRLGSPQTVVLEQGPTAPLVENAIPPEAGNALGAAVLHHQPLKPTLSGPEAELAAHEWVGGRTASASPAISSTIPRTNVCLSLWTLQSGRAGFGQNQTSDSHWRRSEKGRQRRCLIGVFSLGFRRALQKVMGFQGPQGPWRVQGRALAFTSLRTNCASRSRSAPPTA